MEMKVNTASVQVATVKLSKRVLDQLDRTNVLQEGDELVGRLDRSVLREAKERNTVYGGVLLLRKDEYLVMTYWAGGRGDYMHLPKLVV